MKNSPRFLFLLGGIVLGLALSFAVSRFLPGSSSSAADGKAGSSAEKATAWTCSMHPQVQQPDPGKCPICAMDLIPVGSAGMLGPRQFAMSTEAKALAKIETTPVERQLAEAEIRLVGKVDYDETRIRTIAARFPARIDRLYVDFTGIQVNQGDHLAHVYSEDLLTAQRELLVARGNPAQLEIVRDKLRLLGLPDSGIRSVEKTGQTFDQMDIDAPTGGVVIERLVSEGAYVKKGDPLFRIADLSEVWVKLDAYESDLQWVRYGQTVTFEAEALPGREFEGTVAFLSPTLDATTRTVNIRVNAGNPDGALKPGMFVKALVTSRLAVGGRVVSPQLKDKWISPMHPEVISDEPGNCPVCGMALVKATDLGYDVLEEEKPDSLPLVIPTSAVLLTGKRAVVYVEVPKTDQPTYEGREIELGPRAGDVYLVESGLEEGERVVTQGAFKIDSALQIVAKPSMMSGASESDSHGHFDGWELTAEQFGPILTDYLALQTALASDDFEAAQKAVRSLGENEAIAEFEPATEIVANLTESAEIEALRTAFAPLAYGMLELAKRPELSSSTTALHQAHCPMAFDNAGADWLQQGGEIRNPYFGARMLKCGTIAPVKTEEDSAEKPAPSENPHAGHAH